MLFQLVINIHIASYPHCFFPVYSRWVYILIHNKNGGSSSFAPGICALWSSSHINLKLIEAPQWAYCHDRLGYSIFILSYLANGIQFIDKYDSRCFLFCQSEGITNYLCSVTNKHETSEPIEVPLTLKMLPLSDLHKLELTKSCLFQVVHEAIPLYFR